MADAEGLRERLLNSDEEYRSLHSKHHELDERLQELSHKHYLSEPEQLEEVTLKKRKLQLKDRMEDIARRHRAVPTEQIAAQANRPSAR